MENTEQIYANALNLIPALGPVRLLHLYKHFQSWQKAWEAKRPGYVACGLNPKLVEQIIAAKTEIDPVKKYEELSSRNIQIVLIQNLDYPQILKEISAAPPLLYIRGNKEILNNTCIGVVGTRKITAYGKQACAEIVSGLVETGLTIVSGLAFGVDACALNSAVAQDSASIAVLASPLDDDSISPKPNFQLAHQVLKKGCLLSEHGLGANVQKQNFPIRNRIISGLSVGTVVVEADLDSGSLITANYALEQNREVFAVPGSIYSDVSKGTNNLIKKGAKLVSSYKDILEELNMDLRPVPEVALDITTDETELKIIDALSREPIHIDDLTRQLHIPASQINATLVLLEMKGRVRNLGGAKFSKIR